MASADVDGRMGRRDHDDAADGLRTAQKAQRKERRRAAHEREQEAENEAHSAS